MKNSCWNRDNLVFIAAGGVAGSDFEKEKIKVLMPYRGNHIFIRIFRELCFSISFLPKKIWYRKEIFSIQPKYICIFDPLITKAYLKWIISSFPQAQVNYIYDNMVGNAKNLRPEDIPSGIRIWTYDDYDSSKYGIRKFENYWVAPRYFREKEKVEYDVFFVGRDKGRGDWAIEFEKKLNKMGLKTKFIITKDGRLSRRKPYYEKSISYEDILRYDVKSKAILNITMPNQKGVTLRDIEAAAMNLKLITTNRYISEKDLYIPDNVFVLKDNNLNDLPEFLAKPVRTMPVEWREEHSLEKMMDEITGADHVVCN